ncbi:dienelactone hydrolase family protein [Kutzneria viridogrisea]|uniref:Dienelactone hydrolase domain-containing protein n=2 Tax=Kutzneria TaxID=43356 RepID=W5WMH0_9PSEU|nr:dienelactone hydrolase family protein [Kutzneria albida]AHI01976.1 hypothetical protein KALB_8619 [Kutzneria albida DSM 43870]MBA8929601.1 dienelactone hydrolase [Kutzneria viridogrisea]
MADIVLFHSILGLRPGVLAAADRFRTAGHTVHTPDLYEGAVFEDYRLAERKFEQLGVEGLLRRTEESVADLPEDLVYAGFSNGGASAAHLAATRPGALGALMLHSSLPLAMMRLPSWPASVPVQVHYGEGDPWRRQEWVDAMAADVRASGAGYEYFSYPVNGHLFTDPTLPEEYHEESAELLFQRALAFVGELGRGR